MYIMCMMMDKADEGGAEGMSHNLNAGGREVLLE